MPGSARTAALSTSPLNWAKTFISTRSYLQTPLPLSVHIVSMQSLSKSALLIRIAHMFGVGEDAILSQNVSVSLANLFVGFTVHACVDMTLPGPIPLQNAPSTTFTTTEGMVVTLPVLPEPPVGAELTITLSAMQIRTFQCDIEYTVG